MKIDTHHASASSGFYAVEHATFTQTLNESEITFVQDMGGVTIHYGVREGAPIWLMENSAGLNGIWVEETAGMHR